MEPTKGALWAQVDVSKSLDNDNIFSNLDGKKPSTVDFSHGRGQFLRPTNPVFKKEKDFL